METSFIHSSMVYILAPFALRIVCFSTIRFFIESIETCTAFLLLLIELFGEKPDGSQLTGVAIDRGSIIKTLPMNDNCFVSL